MTITGKTLSLKGVTTANSSAAVIVPPPGGLVANTTVYGQSSAAQISVRNADGITISGLTVDGTNNNVNNGCATGLYGIVLQNVSGTVSGNSVSHQVQPAGLDGCQNGLAIDVENVDGMNRTIAIKNNYVSDFQKNGITADDAGLTANITGNTVIGRGTTTGAANNSIQMAFGTTGSISQNYVADDVWEPDQFGDTGDAAAGILVYESRAVTIGKNVVENTQYGIAVVGDGSGNADVTSIMGNHIGATHFYDAVDLCGSSLNTVTMNTIYGSDESAIHLDSSCGSGSTGNNVQQNVINGGCAGILEGSGSSYYGSANSIIDAQHQELVGSDICQAMDVPSPQMQTMMVSRRATGRRHPQPAR